MSRLFSTISKSIQNKDVLDTIIDKLTYILRFIPVDYTKLEVKNDTVNMIWENYNNVKDYINLSVICHNNKIHYNMYLTIDEKDCKHEYIVDEQIVIDILLTLFKCY